MNKEERSIAVDEAEQVQDGNGVTILDLFNAVRKHVITAVVTLVIVMVAICAYTLAPITSIARFKRIRNL